MPGALPAALQLGSTRHGGSGQQLLPLGAPVSSSSGPLLASTAGCALLLLLLQGALPLQGGARLKGPAQECATHSWCGSCCVMPPLCHDSAVSMVAGLSYLVRQKAPLFWPVHRWFETSHML
jgi:hypothetical protein